MFSLILITQESRLHKLKVDEKAIGSIVGNFNGEYDNMNYDPEMNRYKGVDARTLGYVLNSNTPSNCLSENKLRSNRTQSCRVNARMRQQPPHQEECMSTQSGTELDIGCIGEPSLAMVYSPYQRFDMLYSASDALCRGTLFKELDKPLMIGGRRL